MMADVGGAFLGYAVSKLLDEVLIALKHLKNRSANLLQLQNLLERLQPSVKELSSFVRDEKHPAGKWVIKLREQLEKSRDLVNDLDGSRKVNRHIFRLYRTSKESLEVYDSIQALLQEASTLQWASGMSIQRVIFENDHKMLEELRAAQERDEQLLRRIASLTSKVDILSTISKLERAPSSGTLDGASSAAVPTGALHTDSASHVPKPKVTFGGAAVANELIGHLLSRDCKKWVGLWGMGGIGKTFTASKVYYDSSIQQHFSGGIFWLTVSKDQPGPKHLLKQLLEKLEGRNSVSQLPDNLETAKSYLKSMLDRDRVLLVLDDVWQKDVLEHLDVISESKKGVILVTTRDQLILTSVLNLVKIFEIPRLSPEDSWQLFSYHAFHLHESVVPSELEAVAKRVVEECQGLPLALEVIGSTMADKELVPAQKALGQTTLRVWEIALERLRNANYGNSEYEALYLKLQLSVDSLSEQDSRLQDCFFYFAAFPEDENVRVDRLVRMWNAEGLVQDDVNSSLSGEEEGKVLLGFLVAKSMIEVTEEGLSCKVHDVMRDLAQRNLKRNFATGEELQASTRDCLYAPGLKEPKLPKEWTISVFPSSARRLSLRGGDLRQFPEPEHFEAPDLQVLILSYNRSLQSFSTKFFENLSSLRVLDLSFTGITNIPGTLLRRLKSLVLLDLSFCEQLREVSDEIDSLHSLEFLLLDACEGLQKLPVVNNLTKLKWFSTGVPTTSAEVPTMSTEAPRQEDEVDAKMDAQDGAGCWQGWRPWRRQHGHSIPHKHHGRVLHMHHGRSRGGIPFVLPTNLQRLELGGERSLRGKYSFDVSSLYDLEKLILRETICPAGMGELHRLKELTILGCYETPLLALGMLRQLQHLDIAFFAYDTTTEFDACEGAFASLKSLKITCESGLEKMIVFQPGTMQKIESLEISLFRRQCLPISMTELCSLKSLILRSLDNLQINDINLEIVLKQSDCFPHLEVLKIVEFGTIEAVRKILPGHILDREKQGKLKIDT